MSQPNLMSQFAEAFEKQFHAPQPKVSATEKRKIIRSPEHYAPHIGLKPSRPK